MTGQPTTDLQSVYRAIVANPGIKGAELAHMVGVLPCSLPRVLVTMEYNGFLLSEDERGRLYPFALARQLWGEGVRVR